MRLWHIDLIPYLPKSQLLAQWRELNSIFKKQDNHILINYVYDYPKDYLLTYADKVILTMESRGYKIKNFDNFNNYFYNTGGFYVYGRFKEHNNEYLIICFMNLLEKYRRGQKDFNKDTFVKLYNYVNSKIDLKAVGVEK